ncbi:RNA polymerase sigma factor [Streptomyces ortus]|uniref:Sigma-70 family RNA polymerase sigma factor n=1 Tax=Streptomyces ortus TaxID=2867268 RepID=A0ABT3V0F7_9ACTN|nr:sigma-70 family RNA polymerase sigma factor [Streptomyces ortus]MCX4233512.1 sigma-70 family RNA polymerase sigma factor [Streptomyces ortus]
MPRQRGTEDLPETFAPSQSVETDGAATTVQYGPLRPEDVFVPWYEENIDRLVRRVVWALGGHEDASSAIHDVCTRLLNMLSEGKAPFGSREFTVYAERSVTNEIRSRIRKKSRQPRHVPIYESDGGYTPESFVEEREVLRRVLDELPENQKKVLKLFFYEGMTPAEIAAVLDLTPGSVSTYKSNGLRSLREHPAIARLTVVDE